MKSFRRFLALMLCAMLIVTSVPGAAFADELGSSAPTGPLFGGSKDLDEESDSPTPTEEEFYDLQYIDIFLKPYAKTDYVIQSDLGAQFEYRGEITLDKQTTFEFTTESRTTALFTQYEDVTVWIKAPAGIILTDSNRNPLPLGDEESAHPGYYPLVLGTIDAPTTGRTKLPITNSLYAYMEGNGTTSQKTFGPASVIVEAHTTMVKGIDHETDTYEYEDISFIQDQISYDTGYSLTGLANGTWTHDKYKNEGVGSDAVVVDGDDLVLTYYIRVGAGTNGDVNAQDNAYVRYGLIDLQTMALKDSISAVENKYGVTVWPKSVKGYAGGAECGSYDADKHVISFDENSLATIDASSVGVADPVKRNTVYKVVLRYDKDDFVYPASEVNPTPFTFTDTTEFSYALKDASSYGPEGDTESSQWYDQAGGGNVGAQSHIFMGEHAVAAKDYSTVYSSQFGFGTISYDIYPLDEGGQRITKDGKTVSFHIDMVDHNDGKGFTGTEQYGSTVKNRIPVGNVEIVADFSRLNSSMVVPVDANNDTILDGYTTTVEVKEGKCTTIDVYLRYKLGGIVNVTKEYRNKDGSTDSSDLRAKYSATRFTLTPGFEGGSVVEIVLDSNGKGVAPLATGTYTVTETAPDGFVNYVGEITIVEGDENYITNEGNVLVNYPAKADINVYAYKTDKWIDGDVAAVKNGRTNCSDSGVTYQVEKKTASGWEAVGTPKAPGTTVTVDRFDTNGDPITYRVRAIDTDGKNYAGNITDDIAEAMMTGDVSVEFDFEDDGHLLEKVDLYFLKTVTITVKKTVNDKRTVDKATADGWTMNLTAGDSSFIPVSAATGSDGSVKFEGLRKYDAAGNAIIYTVTETIPAGQEDLWVTTYTNNTVSTNTADASKGDQTINVVNTANVAELVIEKVDSKNNATKLQNVEFLVYATVDGVKMYVTDTKENGIRVLSAKETDAAAFVTNSKGKITVDSVRSGLIYTAHETKTAEDYYLNEADSPLNGGKAIPANTSKSTQVTNVKHPTIKVSKHGYNKKTGKLDNLSAFSGAAISYDLYTKNESGSFVPVLDKNSQPVKMSATCTSNAFVTSAVLLEQGGDYYVVETAVSTDKLVMPTSENTVAPAAGGYANAHEIKDGKVYFGPFHVDENANVSVTCDIIDYVNSTTLTVTKRNSFTGEVFSTVENTGFTYRMVTHLPENDTELIAALKKAGWSTDYSNDDFTETAPSGSVWIFSPAYSTDTCAVVLKDSFGTDLEYWVIEITAPDGYYNRINADGTEGNNVTKAAFSNNAFTAGFSDAPKAEVKVGKFLDNVADINNGINVVYYQSGITIGLYSVDKTTGKMTLVTTQTTTYPDGAVFSGLNLDFTHYDYVAVELDSCGYDYKKEVSPVDYSVSLTAGDLNGMTVDDLAAINGKGTNYRRFTQNDISDSDADGIYTAETDFMNYNPSIQLQFNKFADTNKNGVKDNGEQPLAMCKYRLYVVPKSVWDAAGGSEQEKAAQFATAAYADQYATVYETDKNGQFYTNNYDYNEQNVYIFQETEAAAGYVLNEDFVVVDFSDYQGAKNTVYICPDVPNVPSSGPGDAFLRYLRVEVDKYADNDIDMAFSSEDTKLGGVTFDLHLVDKSRNIVESEQFDRFFTTGTLPDDISFATSETFFITEGFIADINRVKAADDIFTFYYDGTEISYADFLAGIATGDQSEFEKLEVSFGMVLVENTSKLPPMTLPYDTNYYITIKTGENFAPGTNVTVNKEWTDELNNPVLNAYGNHVYADLQKLVDNGSKWVPADADDYVEYTFTAQGNTGDDPRTFTRRIDSSNFDKRILVELHPGVKYIVFESHAPKNYDKPAKNYFEIPAKELSLDPALGTLPVTEVKFTNTPYYTITIHKQDSEGNPLKGITLKAVYSSGSGADTVKGANFETLDTTVVTNADGDAGILLPKYDYRKNYDGKTTSNVNAVYKIVELDGSAQVSAFSCMNTETFNATADKTVQVRNPEKGSLSVTKYGVTGSKEPLAGVKFTLQFSAATQATLGANTADAYKTVPGTFTALCTDVTTNAQGELNFENLSTGWYKLIETIPEGYMYEGSTYTVTFFYVTPGDIINMNALKNNSFWAKQNVYLISETISGTGVDQQYCETAVDGADLEITNIGMAYLDIAKLFPDTDIEGIQIPDTIDVTVSKVNAGTNTYAAVGTKTITIGNKQGKITELFALEPGSYIVTETTGNAYIGSYALTSDSASVGETMMTADGTAMWKTAAFTLTSADTRDDPALVSIRNYSNKMQLKAIKVDSERNGIEGAEFVLYEDKSGTRYYWTGSGWTNTKSSAKKFASGADGLLNIEFTVDNATASIVNGELTGKYTLKETKSLEGLTLIDDTEFTFKGGMILDLTENEADYIVDGDGLTVKLTLIGHTKDNAPAHADDQDYIPDILFRLYKVLKNDEGEIISYTLVTCDDSVSNAETDENGKGAFCFLEKLNENESYILVQAEVDADHYWDTKTYFDTSMGKTTLTVGGTVYDGVEVFTFDSQESSSVANVNVYNMPYSYLLVLKYDYEDPTAIPTGALFRAENEDDSSVFYTPDAITDKAKGNIADIAARVEDYTYNSGIFTDASGVRYGYSFCRVLPGTYTVTETKQGDGYLYTPDAAKGDPWYPVHTGVKVGDDGEVATAVYANVPVPGSNNVGITKTTVSSDGKGAGGALVNLQETKPDGSWQSVTYEISDFAPAPLNGTPQPYVRYPMSKLILEDMGQTFKANTSTVNNVESYITTVTVGKANYVDEPVADMMVAVYGVNDEGEQLLRSVNVANGPATVSFTARTYTGFKLVYNADNSGEARTLREHFLAEAVKVSFEMLQGSDGSVALANKAINTARLTMGYNIGVTNGSADVSVDDDADIRIDTAIDLPEGKLTKSASVNGGAYVTGPDLVEIRGGDAISYKLVFENKDDELAIPNAFIADVLPRSIDIDITNPDNPYCTVAAYDASGAVDTTITVGDIVFEKESHYIYAKTVGDLKAGGKLVMTINGSVNTTAAMDEYGTAKGIVNNAYAGSSTVKPKSSANKYGAAFNVNGSPANVFAPISDLASYAGTSDSLEHQLWNDSDLTIMKEVAGTITGADNYMSGSANVAVTESEGNVYYKITVSTKNAVAKDQMRIADLLPYVGDKEMGGASRYSGFEVITPGSFNVTVGGSSANYSIAYTDSRNYKDYTAAMNNGSFASEVGASDAAGWMITVNQEIAKDQSVVITFICKAPKAIELNEDNTVLRNNLFKRAINSASVSVPKTSGASGRNLVNSNLAYVSIVPEQKVAVGDRIWLDRNANGIQDSGEPDFKLAGSVQLRTFVGSDITSTASAEQIPDTGWYLFAGLTSAMPLDDTGDEYLLGNVINSKLSGYTKTSYQLVVNSLPDGYLITKEYAGNGGVPVTFAVHYDENGYLVYTEDTSDGRDGDSDFVSDGNGRYVTRRFYLPIKTSTFPNLKEGDKVPEAEYLSFDLGVIRTRDLEISKTGADEQPIEGVTYSIYGPYFSKPAGTPADADLVGTITTGEDGIASFKSTGADNYLNYYAYYMVVETDAPKPYDTRMMLASGFVSSTGNAVLTASDKSDTFILNPASGDLDEILTEKVSVEDEYTASGEVVIDAGKELLGAVIGNEPFKTKFAFELKRDQEQGISDFADEIVTLTNNGAGIPSTTIKYAMDEWLGTDGELTFTYTMTEKSVDDKAVTTDPAVYTVTVTITDPDATGDLNVVKTITKDGEDAGSIVFTNEYKTGDLSITKTVSGKQISADGDDFEFTVTLIPDTEDMGKMIYGKNFDVEITTEGSTNKTAKTIAISSDGTGKITLKDKQTAAIKGLPVGTTADVTEKDYTVDGYITEKNGSEGEIDDEEVLAFAFTNTRKVGELSIGKVLSGNAPEEDRSFSFTVTLTNENGVRIDGSYVGEGAYDSVVFTKKSAVTAEATFTLKGGQEQIIHDIPAGTAYEVKEDSCRAYDYNTTPAGETGEITADTTSECTFTNERSAGTLSVSKLVTGSGADPVGDFEFTIVLTYEDDIDLTQDANKPTTRFANADIGAAKDHSVTITAKIRDGETLNIENILVGTTYSVTEANYFLNGFLGAVIDGTAVDVDTKDVVLATAEDSISAEAEADTHTFENVRNAGPLTVKKTLDGNAVKYDHPFRFTVTLTRTDDVPLNLTYTTVKTDARGVETNGTITFTNVAGEENKAQASFEICGSESFRIEDILTDTGYLVCEDDYQSDGYLTDETEFTGTIAEGGCEEEFINRRSHSQLIMAKALAGNSPEYFREFEFTVTLKRENDLLPVDGSYPTVLHNKEGEDVPGSITFVTNDETGLAEATFTLYGNEQLLIDEIYADSLYTVTEEDCSAYGYTTKSENESGTVDKDNSVTCTYTNTRDTGTLTITKTVEAFDVNIPTDRVFRFTVELKHPNGTGVTGKQPTEDQDGREGSISFVDGIATVSLKHGQSLTIKDIRLDYTYTVTEFEYKGVITTSSGESGTITRDGCTASFINNIEQTYQDLKVIKVFDDDNNADRLRPTTVKVQVSTQNGVVGEYELTEANGWSVDLEHLPRYDMDGNTLVYTVIELEVPRQYMAIYTEDGGTITIKNRYLTPFTFVPDEEVPLGAGINMNEGYCFD